MVGWHFSYLIFSRFVIFTFRNYFTKSSSSAGCSRHQQLTSVDISSRRLERPTAGDDFICRNARADKCLCCQVDVWCVLQLMMTLLNYFTLCKLMLCIWRKIIFFCHYGFMKKNYSKFLEPLTNCDIKAV